MFNFDWFFEPFPKDEFFNTIWQKKPKLISHNRPDYFNQFFSSVAVENILEYCQPNPPTVRLVSNVSKEKRDVPFSPNGRLNLDKIRKSYARGYTVVINSVENFDIPVSKAARSFESELGARVQVNSYLTPREAQGFSPHYDTHDVFIGQIEGIKKWKIYQSDSVCPLNEMLEGDDQLRVSKHAASEFDLHPGDVLYIPRGWIHEAETLDTASLHLTFGVHPPLGLDLIASALEDMTRRYPEFREALPIGRLSSKENITIVADKFAELVNLFADNACHLRSADAIDDEFSRRGRNGGDGHLFADVDVLHTLSDKTIIQRRADLNCRIIRVEGSMGIQFINSLISCPDNFESAMCFVAERKEPFCVSSLPELTETERMAFSISLVTEGLCRIISQSEG